MWMHPQPPRHAAEGGGGFVGTDDEEMGEEAGVVVHAGGVMRRPCQPEMPAFRIARRTKGGSFCDGAAELGSAGSAIPCVSRPAIRSTLLPPLPGMLASRFHPVVREWFASTLGEPTPVQVRGWAAIDERRHTLIAAPTGSGKTLAAFLTAIDDLLKEGLDGSVAGRGSRPLRLAAQGAERGHPQESRRAASRHRRASCRRRACVRRRSPPPSAPATPRRPSARR